MSGFRLDKGGRIDRSRPVSFLFDDVAYRGFHGDTLASALLASGVTLVGRSFKYHRKRGIVTAGPEEPCALVERGTGARREPNTPATTAEIYDGFVATSQNRFPSLRFDLGAIAQTVAAFLPAGFYYKTFMWPGALWERVYEPAIRRAAGLGRSATGRDPDSYAHRHHHCDVLVVGLGPAGLAAAASAAQNGSRVLAVEQHFEIGGTLLDDPVQGNELARLRAALDRPNVETLTRTAAIGAYDHGVVAVLESVNDHLPKHARSGPRQILHIVRAARTIFATGSIDRLIAFPNNDLPGVMTARAAHVYATRYGVAVGRRPIFFCNNDETYRAAFTLADAGVRPVAIVDRRRASYAADAARAREIKVMAGFEVADVWGGAGGIAGVRVRNCADGGEIDLAADVLCVSGGQSAQVQLASQARLKLDWSTEHGSFVVAESTKQFDAAGAVHGHTGLRAAMADGARAGGGSISLPPGEDNPVSPWQECWEVAGSGKAFVDLQHDVTADDIRLAHREGYAHVEHAKRYTTHGMGTDQGRIGGLVGSAVLAAARGETVESVGLPKFRPYTQSTAWGALAGPDVGMNFKPRRLLPLHDWHAKAGAVFVNIGLWLRPLVYSPTGDTSWGPVLAEARRVRSSVGVTDVSSLGKIDVSGPDAAIFLDRIYANMFSTLAVGRARYGLMLREDGIMLDDGTTSRLAADRFVVTTTTQKSADVLDHMEWHLQAVWPELDVSLADISDQWAQFAVAGPHARDTLAPLVTGLDFSNEAFPFMAAGEATIAGVAGRLFRISFSGELAYEVSVPAHAAEQVWKAIVAAGAAPYGLDALNLMRVEKGHMTGAEINGTTSAHDLGLARMLKKNGDFIGRALGQREALLAPDRLQLVGILPLDPAARLRGGAHLVAATDAGPSQGYVTSCCMSSVRPGWVGLALLAGGRARHGETLVAASPVFSENVAVKIVSPHHYDPENLRVRA
jgi:methylglutamate dehydrogenase subunit C